MAEVKCQFVYPPPSDWSDHVSDLFNCGTTEGAEEEVRSRPERWHFTFRHALSAKTKRDREGRKGSDGLWSVNSQTSSIQSMKSTASIRSKSRKKMCDENREEQTETLVLRHANQ